MCRFLAYKGRPVLMDELLYRPKNSLILQSVAAHESEEPLNGDGFGVGWYMQQISPSPGLFVSVRPAWNERNLRYLASKVQSGCVFAHVRAASLGEVSEANCHPFHYKNYLFMHNGEIENFAAIKRELRRSLSDEIYDSIRGQTDSEHLFALFLQCMLKMPKDHTAQHMAEALETTVRTIQELKDKNKVAGDSYINVAISDGRHLISLRYCSNRHEHAPTLYYTHGAKYVCDGGICRMVAGVKDEHAVLVVSEKLTSDRKQWKEIPRDHILVVDEDLTVLLRPFQPDRGVGKAKFKVMKPPIMKDAKKKKKPSPRLWR